MALPGFLLPSQDSVPLGDGPTLSLSPVTFDSAGTYVCEASMSTVPFLSRVRSFKLLVQGSGWESALVGKTARGTGGVVWPLSPLPFLSLPTCASHCLFSGRHPPTGSPELRAEEMEPKAEGGWTEGDEVRLTCSARGHPKPELTWSQLGGRVRDCPLHLHLPH